MSAGDPGGWRRVRRFFRVRPADEVDSEIAFHLAMRAAELEAVGLAPEEARERARHRFGDVDAIRDEAVTLAERRVRAGRRSEWWQGVVRDLQVAARGLARRPGLTAGAAVTLALAIGVATSVLAVADAFLLRPYPVPFGDRLVAVAESDRSNDLASNVAFPTFEALRAERGVFEDGVAWTGETVSIRAGAGDAAERRFLQVATGNLFSLLRVPMALGRGFTPEEDRQRAPVLVLSHRYWQSRFGADPSVVGRAVLVGGVPMTIIGVTARGYAGTSNLIAVDGFATLGAMTLWRPSFAAAFTDTRAASLKVWMVRRPGVSMAQVERAAATVSAWLEALPAMRGRGLRVLVMPEWRARPDPAIAANVPVVMVLFGALALLVLVAASVNVAGLALARAQARRGELALRRALGASRARLGRLVVAESLLLGAIALVPGIGLALWLVHRLASIHLATDLPVQFDLEPGWRTYAGGVVVAMGAGLLAGLAPAWQAGRSAPTGALRDEGRGSVGGRARTRLRTTLVVAQLAASLVLLVSAGLFVRSLRGASRVDPGFRTDRLLLASTDVSLAGYDSVRARRFYDALVRRVEALPGVERAALATEVPQGYNHGIADAYVDGVTDGGSDHVGLMATRVSAGYFATMGIAVRAGREFAAGDTSGAPRTVMLNEAAARLLFPGRDAVGESMRLERGGPPVQVVGVVRDVKIVFLGESPRPSMYLPLGQRMREELTLHVATTGDPAAMAGTVRAAFRAVDPALPVYDVRTMEEHLGGGISLVLVRLAAAAATGIGVLGLVLTMVGVYGVVSYGVAQRTREFGVRMALGADRGDLLARVLREGVMLLAAGAGVGAVAALAVSQAMAALLMGVGARDLVAYGGALAVLALAVLLATWLPARRASRMEPVQALRM